MRESHYFKIYLQWPEDDEPARKTEITKTTVFPVVLFAFNDLVNCCEYQNKNVSVVLVHNNRFLTAYEFSGTKTNNIKLCDLCGGISVYKYSRWKCCSEEFHVIP